MTIRFLVAAGISMTAGLAEAETVRVTPLGTHHGEYCQLDRAMLFEDPTGVRILYDPGRTTWEGDGRLGTVHAVLLSHMHGDHVGEVRPTDPQTGTCLEPSTVSTAPDSTTARIVAAKNAMFIAGGEMTVFMTEKVRILEGAPPACITTGLDNETTVPATNGSCTAALRPGGSRFLKMQGQTRGVRLATVTAVHTNGISPALLPGLPAGTTGYVGDATGFVLEFSNGLVVYLTGDTGISSDMETVVRRYYGAELVVANLSTWFATGPKEAAFVVNELVKPRSVIPSHASEVATVGGEVQDGTRTRRFMDLMRGSATDVVIPLSGKALCFDGAGRSVGCP